MGAPIDALGRRLLPLYVATFFQSLALWVPIEKLFMTTIGFNAASVGAMAAVYSIVVPVLEVPSGVLADRWSRRGVLMLACLAAIVAVLVGGLSESVPVYMISAAFLGVFFALQSGTLESIVYDTVLEETGDSDAFESTIGRVRVVESVGLVASALAGGAIALAGGQLRLVVGLTIVGSLLMQGMLEFGPLWLVAFLVPPFLYGPHWAGLTGALGLGGVVGSRAWFTEQWAVRILAAAVVACGVVLALSRHALVVVGAQVILTFLVVAVSIPVTRSLHDAVPSTIRAGVASGVGTLTWLAFVPFALVVGAVAQSAGIDRAGWVFTVVGIAAALLMVVVLPRARPATAEAAVVDAPTLAIEPAPFPADRFLPPDDPDWPGHWATPPAAWTALRMPVDSPEAMAEVRAAIADMPAGLRQVMVLRDVEGRPSDEVSRTLNVSLAEARAMLHQARGLIRAHLERYFERAGGTR